MSDRCLATSWEQTDPVSYVFKLRPGVKWHHGPELTSDDVKFSFERQADQNIVGMNQTIYAEIDKIETPDKQTVKVQLKRPFTPFLTYTASPREGNIVSRDFTEKAGGDLKTTASGTGAFKFVEYVSGNYLKLKRNPDYWEQGKPHVDEITLKYIEDEQSRVAALRTGSADLVRADLPETIQPLQADKSLAIYLTKPLYTLQLMLNNARAPLTDVRVRRAISLALDRQEMVKALTLGQGAVSGYIAPGDTLYTMPDSMSLPYYKQDVEKAKQLLAEAGIAPGMKLTVKVLPEDLSVTAGEMIQRFLKPIGIDLEVLKLERAALIQAFRSVDHEMLINGFQSTVDPDTFLYRTMHSKSTGTWTNVKSPELDVLLEKGRSVGDQAERQKVYRDIQTMVADQAFQITLLARPGLADIAKPFVKGLWPMDKRQSHADQFREVSLEK
jgi:peptide/nickel transport system substrate-binding protein